MLCEVVLITASPFQLIPARHGPTATATGIRQRTEQEECRFLRRLATRCRLSVGFGASRRVVGDEPAFDDAAAGPQSIDNRQRGPQARNATINAR